MQDIFDKMTFEQTARGPLRLRLCNQLEENLGVTAWVRRILMVPGVSFQLECSEGSDDWGYEVDWVGEGGEYFGKYYDDK